MTFITLQEWIYQDQVKLANCPLSFQDQLCSQIGRRSGNLFLEHLQKSFLLITPLVNFPYVLCYLVFILSTIILHYITILKLPHSVGWTEWTSEEILIDFFTRVLLFWRTNLNYGSLKCILGVGFYSLWNHPFLSIIITYSCFQKLMTYFFFNGRLSLSR